MKSLNFKPLIILLPLVIILAALILIDMPNSSGNILGNGTKNQALANDPEKGEWTFVVGKTGSLKGGYEPIYETPDVNSEQIAELQYNCVVIANKEQSYNGWVYVDLCDKGAGYVKAENVSVKKVVIKSNDKVRNEIINNSLNYLGLRFVKGGKSLDEGVDCTNFASLIYKMSGIDLPNTTYGIDASGKKIDESKMKPGDIIYYDKANDGSGHVALYLGKGYVINSAGHSGRTYPEGGVRICKLKYMDRDHYYPIRVIDKEGGDHIE